ncbi:MAG: RsmE family RNA methyltransferase [Bacteroidota bacterium]|nr:RsmE family RNA methyltransferase [Bacteroidota bacterium]
MQLFYTSNPNSNYLDKEEFYHCIKVLRNKKNKKINLTDGKGNLYESKILNISKQKCEIELPKKIKSEKQKIISHIVIAPTKSFSRIEWAVEKLTEIGINKISFIYTNNSERRELKVERLQKKSISAMKQSKSVFKPVIENIISLNNLLEKYEKYEKYENKFVADIKSKKTLNKIKTEGKSIFLIGPEGDFTTEEMKKISINGFTKITLGNKVLRTETAAIMAGYLIKNL